MYLKVPEYEGYCLIASASWRTRLQDRTINYIFYVSLNEISRDVST